MCYPLVSIIIPVYNGSNYLSQAINSALNQTYKNIEIIVVNDGSCDDNKTENLALSYGDKIRYIHKTNGGSSSALNVGIKNMRGEYFSWLSHDDVYLPEKISKQIDAIEECESKNVMVVSRATLIDENNNSLKGSNRKRPVGLVKSLDALKWVSHGKGINGCAILLPKGIIDNVGLLDENFVYLNDLEYWYRTIMKNIDLLFTDDIVVQTRIHGQQVSVTKRERFDGERHALATKLLTLASEDNIDRAEKLKQIAYFCASENLTKEYSDAKRELSNTRSLRVRTRVYLSFVWCKGYALRLMKYIRKKIFFHR